MEEALKLVQAASTQQGSYNSHRVAHPKRNTGISKDSAKAQSLRKTAQSNGPKAPVLTPTLRAAAALVAEHQARQKQANGTLHKTYSLPKYLKGYSDKLKTRDSGPSTYWLGLIKHTGLAPMGANDSYPVFRDVTDPMFAGGAKGDGIHDDTEAINGKPVLCPLPIRSSMQGYARFTLN